jgi:hypothetical protein
MVRAASGLPICGCKKCKAQFDHERILKTGLPICSHRNCAAPRGIDLDDIVGYAEAEAFALLEANWRVVKHLVNKLCRCDRFLLPDLASEKQISIFPARGVVPTLHSSPSLVEGLLPLTWHGEYRQIFSLTAPTARGIAGWPSLLFHAAIAQDSGRQRALNGDLL